MASANPAPQPKGDKPKHRMFRIVIGLGDDNEPRSQFIGADGMDFLIRRGEEIDVPEPVLGVLDTAVKGVPEVDPSDPAGLRTIMVDRQRFPYTIVRAL
mgnify:CR=1 FL=1